MNRSHLFILLILLFLLTACAAPGETRPAATGTALQSSPTPSPARPTSTAVPAAPANPPAAPPEPTPTLSPDAWKDLPVIPETISQRIIEIYRRGLELGNNPHAFSKVGDSNSTLPEFLGDFDRPRAYRLGDYAYLQPAVDHFSGYWSRGSMAVKIGMSTNGVLSPLWADWRECKANESPLECELRINKPAFVLVGLGTNDAYDVRTEPIEERMRKVIEIIIAHGSIPIMTTKVDNLEGDHTINRMIARLAYEYDIPLYNLWAAMQPLPKQGLETAFHYTSGEIGRCEFDDPQNLQYGWTIRNLTALQTLDAVWRGVTGQPPARP